MYQVAITRSFIARHFLIGGDWGAENAEHSHHYQAEIIVESGELDQNGYLIDIVVLEQVLVSIIARYADKVLNDLAPFTGLNPSIEHFSRIIWEQIRQSLDCPGKHLTVKLWENDHDWASFRGVL